MRPMITGVSDSDGLDADAIVNGGGLRRHVANLLACKVVFILFPSDPIPLPSPHNHIVDSTIAALPHFSPLPRRAHSSFGFFRSRRDVHSSVGHGHGASLPRLAWSRVVLSCDCAEKMAAVIPLSLRDCAPFPVRRRMNTHLSPPLRLPLPLSLRR